MLTKQQEVDQKEWDNPNNWSTIYFSKQDSRVTVPKKNPNNGWTINFGHPDGAKWIYYLIFLFFVIGFIVGIGFGFGFSTLV